MIQSNEYRLVKLLEQDDYVIDVFDNLIESADEAYITSHTCDTWEQVIAFYTDYDGITVV